MSEGDTILVQRTIRGDQKAFEILVRRYQTKIAAVIAREVRDPDKVRDLTQETFIKAYRALKSFRGESAFYTWLYRIAANTAKNFLISRSRVPTENDVALDDVDQVAPQLRHHETPEKLVLRDEMFHNLDKALNGLSDSMRSVLIMRDVDGCSYEEIAKALSCPIGTVRSRIYRARQEIIENMQEYLEPRV
ncbi:MAG: sigma-70 family RNA polymerase sigma factor [Nitrospirae bacterium]|nr:sigma-70 family RNA polymerase sigma factor [Magnetococcales bacterium]HAT49151.1 RNA polymerase sigma factor RpoE [Alphaproteobacteria bacterium]